MARKIFLDDVVNSREASALRSPLQSFQQNPSLFSFFSALRKSKWSTLKSQKNLTSLYFSAHGSLCGR